MSESRQTKVTRIEILKAAIQRLFGYDFFISYAWYDGRPYAEALVRRLALKPIRLPLLYRPEGNGWRRSVADIYQEGASSHLGHGTRCQPGGVGE
jgi:hypothetical protein